MDYPKILHVLYNNIILNMQMMKDSLVRSFTWFEPDVLRQSSRSEWPVMLHNLCYLHAAIQLRTRFGHGGWNSPVDFLNICNTELQVMVNFPSINELVHKIFVCTVKPV